MRRLTVIFITVLLFAAGGYVTAAPATGITVDRLRCEYRINPQGVGVARPRFNWIIKSSERGQKQTAYRIVVASSREKIDSDKGDLWDSGKVKSSQTLHVVYNGKQALKSNQQCWWKVQSWDMTGKVSPWSETATWSMGLLKPEDWGKARWIADPKDAAINRTGPMPATMIRKSFKLDGEIKRAMVHSTGLGVYELRINGEKVGDSLLAPECTSYDKQITYQSYDVTEMLSSGDNGIGAMLATGWNGEFFYGLATRITQNAFQGRRGFFLKLDIELEDGKKLSVVSDESWKSTREGPVRESGIYDGEKYDARLEWPGWDTGEFDDSLWRPVIIADYIENPKNFKEEPMPFKPVLQWQRNEPMRVVKKINPVAITEPKRGVYIIDMGQNMAGWCSIQVHGRQGTEIKVRYGEMLDKDGMLYTMNLRRAEQTDTYIKRSDKMEVFEPKFTYHGFRYLEITGRTNIPWRYEASRRIYKPDLKHITGCVVQSAAPDTGMFKCSNEQINRLMNIILWTQRGNMHSLLTDCPQRDERSGWMGDTQAFAQTAIFNMDMSAFFCKWARDVRASQHPDGRFAETVPMEVERFAGAAPAWADGGVIVPWRIYQNYADVRLIDEHYDAAKRWVDWVYGNNKDLLWQKDLGRNHNDWLNSDTFKNDSVPRKGGSVPNRLFATAFFAKSTELVGKMALVTGRKEDAKIYAERAKGIKAAFNRRFVQPDGKLQGDTQAGYALALEFDMLPEELRSKAAKHMVDGFKKYNGHLSTGIQTTHRLIKELSNNGYNEEAYRLVNLKTFPSWGFMLENGATTIWERWDGYTKDSGFQDPTMNSFNHVAFGSVGEWVWRSVVGLNPTENNPGWKHFVVNPMPGGDVTSAKGEYKSIRGSIVSDWKIEGKKFILDLTVPPNTTATVYLPTSKAKDVTIDGKTAAGSQFIKVLGVNNDKAAFAVSSGRFKFESPLK